MKETFTYDDMNRLTRTSFYYGYDHQRIRMEEHVGSTVRTKDYIGMCEYVSETGTSGTKSYTYLNGPSVYWGGPFYFHFSNYIYIKP